MLINKKLILFLHLQNVIFYRIIILKKMKRIALLTFIFIFNFSFSQKKELRKALKAYDNGNIEIASQILSENESVLKMQIKKSN